MLKKFETFIRKRDSIAPKITDAIHFKSDTKHKTTIGGVISILIILFMTYLATRNGYRMLTRH